MKWRRFLRRLALALSFSAVFNGAIYAQVPFYQGRTITVIVSSDAGGTSEDAITKYRRPAMEVLRQLIH